MSFSFTSCSTEKGSTHKQHVILFEHMEIIASAELSDHSDPDTCLIYKGPDVSCEQPIPEIKAVGKELKSDDKITIRDFSSQSLKPRLRKQEKTTLTKALAAG